MTSVSKDFYIDKLDDIVNKYNKTYQNRIKMKPGDLKLSAYIAKGYVPNWSEEAFVIKKS